MTKRQVWLKRLGIAAILAVLGGFVVLAQTAPIDSLRIIESPPDGGIQYHQPETVISSKEIRPVTTGDQGRGVSIFAPHATIFDTLFQPGSDDALGFVGDCHGSVVVNCTFPVAFKEPNTVSKALVCYTNADGSNLPGPIFGADKGSAASFYGCRFDGGAIRLSGGVWCFYRCRFTINALYALEAMDATVNLIEPEFITIPQPPEFSYWAGVPIRTCGLKNGKQVAASKSRIYISNPTLDGKPIEAAKLVYKLDGKTPATGSLRKEFITK